MVTYSRTSSAAKEAFTCLPGAATKEVGWRKFMKHGAVYCEGPASELRNTNPEFPSPLAGHFARGNVMSFRDTALRGRFGDNGPVNSAFRKFVVMHEDVSVHCSSRRTCAKVLTM